MTILLNANKKEEPVIKDYTTRSPLTEKLSGLLSTIGAFSLQDGIAVSRYTLPSPLVSSPVRLLVVSDLHSGMYGESQGALLACIAQEKPDLLLLTGDLFDQHGQEAGGNLFLQAAGKIYPCFYVTGNHECRSEELPTIREAVRSAGVTVLNEEVRQVTVRGQAVQLCGINDPCFFGEDKPEGNDRKRWRQNLRALEGKVLPSRFSVLLSHRPELAPWYRDSRFQLVTAGHAHGGQVRIPGLINGLFTPGEGLFPKYAGGQYPLGRTTMIVSRGLCKNLIPRLWNPPELAVINICPK